MKFVRLSIICTGIVLIYLTINSVKVYAFDYLVDFVGENYKESMDSGEAGAPKIYHTIQVETDIGTKVLRLQGDDQEYRIWLRQYLATAKKLIVKVPDDQEGAFRNSMLFNIDVTMVHPLNGSHWTPKAPEIVEAPPKPPYAGKKYVLIVDDNMKRRSLVEMVVKNLGYPVTAASNSFDALNIFRQQPDKFNLVIADGTIYKGVSSTSLVKNILETAPDIPVILGTDYKEDKVTAMLTDFFSGFSRVVIKPLVLRELPKTIQQVLEKKV